MCFAFGKFAEEEIQTDLGITRAIDYVLSPLREIASKAAHER